MRPKQEVEQEKQHRRRHFQGKCVMRIMPNGDKEEEGECVHLSSLSSHNPLECNMNGSGGRSIRGAIHFNVVVFRENGS